MRLSEAKIRDLAAKTAVWLASREDVKLLVGVPDLAEEIGRCIREELHREDALEQEVERILVRYQKAIDTEGADPSVLRLKIKKQLARERGIVL